MDVSCEAEIPVQNEHALCFSVVTKPAPVLEYIKTISSLVGARHILAVFEINDVIKVYFDDKRYVDTLIRTGIHVMGHHVGVDYAVPPGTKVVLSNIDPIISNFDLMRLLTTYGTIVSPVIRLPISDDMEFCHIDYGMRYVYMILDKSVPDTLEFQYGDQLYMIRIKVHYDSSVICAETDDCHLNDTEFYPNVATNDSIAQPSDVNAFLPDSSDPIVVSVESISSEAYSNEQPDASKPSIKKRRRVKLRNRVLKTLRLKRTKLSPTSRAAKRITQNIKHKLVSSKNKKHYKKRKQVTCGKKSSCPSPPVLKPILPISPSDVNNSSLPLLDNDGVTYKSSCRNILSRHKLKMFIDEVKHRRTPLEVVEKYLGYYNNDMLLSLIEQLSEYKISHNSISLRLRIQRLTKALKEAL